MNAQLAFDLRSDAERQLAIRLAAFREHMDQDWRRPGRYTRIRLPAGAERKGTRCLRCGKPCMPYDRITTHDRGFCGCFGIDERCFQYIEDLVERERAFFDRADREAFPDCARCGHPWGLHLGISVGSSLPNTQLCTYCGPHCHGYIRPPRAKSPWGTCPGCWARTPAKCVCVQ